MTTNKLCPRCHQVMPDKPQLPVAHNIFLHSGGRQLFSVEGREGLWVKLGQLNGGVEQDESVQASIKMGKGRTGVTLYRQRQLERQLSAFVVAESDVRARDSISQVREALKPCAKCDYVESDGSLFCHCDECKHRIVSLCWALFVINYDQALHEGQISGRK